MKLRKFKKIMIKLFLTFLIIGFILSIFTFGTKTGYKLRVFAAEIILSSQHRYLAKFTFLPSEKISEMQERISNPKYLNTHKNDDLTSSIKESIDKGDASYKDSSDKLNELYLSMVEARNLKEGGKKVEYSKVIKKNKKKSQEKLIVKVENIDKKYSDHFFTGKILTISNPKNLKLASSKGQQISKDYGEQIDFIAKRENALVAVNASGFLDANGTGNGGTAIGIVIEDGKITNTPGGNKAKDYVAGLTEKGVLYTGFYSSNELIDLKVKYAAGFKPQLIADGKKMIKKGNGGWGYGPRTAIGQKKDGSIVLVVIDGRQTHSLGASMKDVQNIMFERGVINAMAMDGGSSAIMYFDEKIVTTPSSVNNIPRYIPNAWVVTPNKDQQVDIYQNDELIKTYVQK